MDLDFGIALAGFIVGIVVGLTGMGGGALMTPVLVLGFGIEPLAAVSSDLVAAVVMKPIGGGIHFRRGTVHTGLVKWLAIGSVPGALLGSYVISHISGDVGDTIKIVLGAVLLIAAAAMAVRWYLSSHRGLGGVEGDDAKRVPVRRAATLAIGLVGGTIVGMTSVGSGSLMIVALMLLYPTLSSRELVGTDLVQAVPLVLAAAIGHLIWGEFELGLTTSLLIGSVPGVIIGAQISSHAPGPIHPARPRARARAHRTQAAERAERGAAGDPGDRARGWWRDVVRHTATRSRAARSDGGVGVTRLSTRLQREHRRAHRQLGGREPRDAVEAARVPREDGDGGGGRDRPQRPVLQVHGREHHDPQPLERGGRRLQAAHRPQVLVQLTLAAARVPAAGPPSRARAPSR